MRIFLRKDAPVGFAVLIGVFAWLSSQAMTGFHDMLILSYESHVEQTKDGPLLDFVLTNQSIAQAVVKGSYSLVCPASPDGTPSPCLRAAFTDRPDHYADALRVPPWNVAVQISGSPTQAAVDAFSLPAGGVLELQVGLADAEKRPELNYDIPNDTAELQTPQIFAANPMFFVFRNFYWVLGGLWLLVLIGFAGWAFWPSAAEKPEERSV